MRGNYVAGSLLAAVALCVLGAYLGVRPAAVKHCDESAGHVRRLRRRVQEAEARVAAAERALGSAVALYGVAEPAAEAPGQFIHVVGTLPARRGDLLMMTYATGGVREMLHNWVMHVQRLRLQLLVAAMDRDVVAQCEAQRFDCLDWSHTATGADSDYVRGSFGGFRALGVRKIDALLPVLRAGVHVVLSDVDCVWSSSPAPMFHGLVAGLEDFAHADVLVATDCMDPGLDLSGPGCWGGTVDKNTGVLAIRATPDGIAAMTEWRVRLAIGEKDEQDQTTFNDLLDGNGRGHRWGMSPAAKQSFGRFAREYCAGLGYSKRGFNRPWDGGGAAGARHAAGSRRIFEVCLPNTTHSARVGVFPITAVAGGHTFFVQQLQSATAQWPMAVHATYQFGDQADYPFGKRQRFRDWGMWLVDDEEELITGPTEEPLRYLVLEDDEPTAAAKDWIGGHVAKDLHVRGEQHVHSLEYTRRRLAHGFALARALNRTVVLPTIWCYCDKFWHRLDRCAIPSASEAQPLPFACPLDHVLDPTGFHGQYARRAGRPRRGMLAARADGPWQDGLPFRGRHWLRTLGAHPRIGMSTARLGTAAGGESTFVTSGALLEATRSKPPVGKPPAAVEHEFVPGSDGPRLVLPAGQSAGQLREALSAYRHVRLLQVSLTDAASLLGCYEDENEANDMRLLSNLLFQHSWCYRPIEMTTEWSAVERHGKPKHGDEPWCVWGFVDPETPKACPAP